MLVVLPAQSQKEKPLLPMAQVVEQTQSTLLLWVFHAAQVIMKKLLTRIIRERIKTEVLSLWE